MPSVPRSRQRYGGTHISAGAGQQPATGGQRMRIMKNGGGFGQEKYLWVLVALEAIALGAFRHGMRRYHGG